MDGVSSAEYGGGGAFFAIEPESFVSIAGLAGVGVKEWCEVDLSLF